MEIVLVPREEAANFGGLFLVRIHWSGLSATARVLGFVATVVVAAATAIIHAALALMAVATSVPAVSAPVAIATVI